MTAGIVWVMFHPSQYEVNERRDDIRTSEVAKFVIGMRDEKIIIICE